MNGSYPPARTSHAAEIVTRKPPTPPSAPSGVSGTQTIHAVPVACGCLTAVNKEIADLRLANAPSAAGTSEDDRELAALGAELIEAMERTRRDVAQFGCHGLCGATS